MKYLQIRSLILILAIALAGTACDNGLDSTGPGEDPATVDGRVENNESQNQSQNKNKTLTTTAAAVEGATVTAARITSDGSLETISDAETETNAQGEFSLDISAEAVANYSGRIVVMAEQNSQQWKAFVTGELESGSSVAVQPLTVESSGEAEVYSEIIAEGNAEIVSKADVEAYIDAEASSEIRSNAQMAATFAEALAAEAEARAQFFANQSAEISDEQMENIMTAKTDAQAQLESDLHAASSTEDKEAAMDTFFKAVTEAYVNAGINAQLYAEAKELSGRVIVKHSSEASAEAVSELRTNAALIASYAIDAAVQARMEAEGVAQSNIDAATQAAVTLRSDIRSSAEGSKQELDAAFATYNDAVVTALSQEFSASSETILTINSEINESNGLKATLESSVEATASTSAIVDAYAIFSSSVKSMVDSSFSSATDAEAEFVADIMVLVNLAN